LLSLGFNGATTFQPWKFDQILRVLEVLLGLQWGHDFSAVEMALNLYISAIKRGASMGPRLFSRGNVEPCLAYPSLEYSFNGATTFQPWKSPLSRANAV